MKKTAITLLTGLALAATAQAGEDYSAKSAKAVVPAAAPCLWTWFAGGSGGYVTDDWDEDMWTLHLGKEYKCPDSNCSHSIYLEVGYTDKDLSGNPFSIDTSQNNQSFDHSGEVKHIPYYESYDLEMNIIPITVNYKYECSLTNNLNWYVGAGAGVAIVDADLTHQESGDPAENHSDDDVVFYANFFAGVVYNFTPSFEVFGGARYIYMDDPSLGSDLSFHGVDDIATLDETVFFELGGRFNF